MTNEVAIEILEMLKIRPRRGSSTIIAQTAVNVALQTGINALYHKKKANGSHMAMMVIMTESQ